ncbi:HK97 family phage prohead protease [Loigolactobacillus coryniformis]|uniref:Peptidase U35 n=1 Tax=Loigolactobacillus coryniformis subsp. torquens DSM 20004 = KCTC 3535 TaxID=1423822 RepID=A0A2D1KMM7_9LACO|nr:HK97 family phage prohead protease [Loigolactobacillus coryniformis]ATO43407.1 peptidase U35 [Loigolactobacillus coryniformis subsp. torquens DSM 20004 = KCTC 3535]MDN5953014.1 HK97 family phage prohead protease [Loigolactobacillus coryniformis]
MTTGLETRQITTTLNLRQIEDSEESVIEGYALKFNKPSDILGGFVRFREILDSHALDETDMANVVATFNHDQNQVLGRTGINLDLEVDNIGLKFRVKPTDTQFARDLLTNIKAGVINQCSFAFTILNEKGAEEWEDSEEEGVDYQRTIRKIDHLYDVSVVTTPAYPDTEVMVGSRSKELVEALRKEPAWRLEQRELLRQIEKEELLKGI